MKQTIDGKTANIFNSFLTSFVPLFATILTFYLSWCYDKLKTRHNKERLELFRETSTNILIMIPLDVFALISYVISTNVWLSDTHVFCNAFTVFGKELPELWYDLSWNHIIRYIFLCCYYSLLSEMVSIIMMVCRRAYAIISNEITLLSDSET